MPTRSPTGSDVRTLLIAPEATERSNWSVRRRCGRGGAGAARRVRRRTRRRDTRPPAMPISTSTSPSRRTYDRSTTPMTIDTAAARARTTGCAGRCSSVRATTTARGDERDQHDRHRLRLADGSEPPGRDAELAAGLPHPAPCDEHEHPRDAGDEPPSRCQLPGLPRARHGGLRRREAASGRGGRRLHGPGRYRRRPPPGSRRYPPGA